ncbi:MAG: disulfide bond formation protein DsbA [Methylobacterium sp.]|nr:disulfide bond formation protein DsbA [Methylobacterium sp.]
MALTVSVFSDVICPWCFLGKRRLEHALHQLELRETTTVEWLPFELNPDMPAEGIERSVYRARKFGAERSAELDAQMTELGGREGISFAFGSMQRTPNTRKAHMLIAAARQHGRGDALVEALFRAYFEQGRDVGDAAVLLDLAEGVGLNRQVALTALKSEELRSHIMSVEAQAAKMQIGGVPFFIVDHQWAVSGAQSAEQWIALIRQRQIA